MRHRSGVLAAGAGLLVAIALAGCGSSLQAVGTGGTGAPNKSVIVVHGPITGFGSLVVNGRHIDEGRAQVTINGEPNRAVSDLALGMVVEVRAFETPEGGVLSAQAIEASALAAGAVESADAAGLRVAGQAVRASASTALQGASDVASVRPGDLVRVYGLRDPLGGAIDATRIELGPLAAPGTRIIGIVSGLAGSRFALGGQAIDASSATLTDLPMGLANGQLVEAQGPALAPGATLVATRVEARQGLTIVEGALVAVEDFVADFAGLHSFRVLGRSVDASGAAITGGSAAAIGNGARVEVAGSVRQGRIVATRVDVRAGASQPPPQPVVSIEGVVSDFVTVASFRVRDQVVDASGAAFDGGGSGELANGRLVRAGGVLRGGVLVATSLALLANPEPEGTPLTVSGTVSAFASAASFRVNGQAVGTTSSTVFVNGTASSLADGRRVDVEGRLMGGMLVAAQVTFLADPPPAPQPQPVELEGFITDYASPQSFRVNNQAIATSAQTRYEGGSATSLANGRRVEIEGTLLAGVVTATRIEFEGAEGDEKEAEVEGSIASYTSISSFVVKGQVIDASAARFLNGSPGKLAAGRKVHVKGPISGGVLRAATLSMEL